MNDYMNKATQNLTIYDSFVKAESVLSQYDRVACSVSGGADSDVMIDLLTKIDHDKKVRYVWFNTGLEYQATKDHLEYLENRYDITIERESSQIYPSLMQRIRSTFSFKVCQSVY